MKDVSPFAGFQKKTSKGTGQRCPSQKGHGGERVHVQQEVGRASSKKMVESDTVHQEMGGDGGIAADTWFNPSPENTAKGAVADVTPLKSLTSGWPFWRPLDSSIKSNTTMLLPGLK